MTSCQQKRPLRAELDFVRPAAAAGSPTVGLRESLLNGLRLRLVSACRDEGDLERLSNRDGLRGSGSVWSKRDRLERRSSSAILV